MEESDPFISINLKGYIVERRCGAGQVGAVYKARLSGAVEDIRAIKFIPLSNLRADWQNEINKVTRLATTDGIVPYVDHGDETVAGVRYRWIAWRYIQGEDLKKLIGTRQITIPMLCDVIRRVLSVLHACKHVQTEHGDLHAGNILVEAPNPMNIDQDQRRIWVTDFGYLSASMGKDMLDDYCGLSVIIGDALSAIDFHSLEGSDKRVYTDLKTRFSRDLIETNPMEGAYVRSPRDLLLRLEAILQAAQRPAPRSSMRVGDYLAAEILGDRYEEWKALFVPQFVGAAQILGRNLCVLTGLRGCGKTTVFRRLTALFDYHLGPSGVPGADSFIGFYVNARAIAEAFPWLPSEHEAVARGQVIHFFHVCWILEILEWLSCILKDSHVPPNWLTGFFRQFYGDKICVTNDETSSIHHLRSFFAAEREKSRLRSRYRPEEWELSQLDFLDLFAGALEDHVPAVADKPFYFFLDDYSTPLVTESTQRILNAIVFRRSSKVLFKVATESVESIALEGLHGKVLEQEDDFLLIDSGTEALQRNKHENRKTVISILQPRLNRDATLSGLDLTVDKILGKTPYTNVGLANNLRANNRAHKTRVVYHGTQTFCDLWSSNTRELITLFADLVSLIKKPDESSLPGPSLVSPEDQDRLIRNAGSRFRDLLVSATDPTKKLYELRVSGSYGEHLQRIADAFHEIADHELQTKNSKNGTSNPPKQARRIEITDISRDLPDDITPYYKGMIRYGLFIRDWRGKSARGKAVPRLVLRGILIPYFTLTFSRRDSVTMEWDEFCKFIRDPKRFAAEWKVKSAHDESLPLTPGIQDNLPGFKE